MFFRQRFRRFNISARPASHLYGQPTHAHLYARRQQATASANNSDHPASYVPITDAEARLSLASPGALEGRTSARRRRHYWPVYLRGFARPPAAAIDEWPATAA